MMTNQEYHADPRIGGSLLRRCFLSPAHARHALDTEVKVTRFMDVGSAVHCRILTPDRYGEEVWTKPGNPGFRKADGTVADSPWGTTEGKRVMAGVAASGRFMIDEQANERAAESHDLFHEWIDSVFSAGERIYEVPVFTRLWKCKPDCLVVLPDRVVNVSVKTTTYSLHAWQYRVLSTLDGEEGGYDISEAHYAAILGEAYGLPVETMHVLISTKGMLTLQPVILSDEIMAYGESCRQRALANLESARNGKTTQIMPSAVMKLPGYITRESSVYDRIGEL